MISLKLLEHAVTQALQDSSPGLMVAQRQLKQRLTHLVGEFRGNVSAVARSMNKDRVQIPRPSRDGTSIWRSHNELIAPRSQCENRSAFFHP
jgi:uncharacterized protein YcbX